MPLTQITTSGIANGAVTAEKLANGGALLENNQEISENFTIGAGKNAIALGPVTITSGISVTVTSDHRWLILN